MPSPQVTTEVQGEENSSRGESSEDVIEKLGTPDIENVLPPPPAVNVSNRSRKPVIRFEID